MVKRNVGVEIAKIEVELEDVTGTFQCPIIQYGKSNYVRLDQDWMRFFELMAGDVVEVNLTRIKRITSRKEG